MAGRHAPVPPGAVGTAPQQRLVPLLEQHSTPGTTTRASRYPGLAPRACMEVDAQSPDPSTMEEDYSKQQKAAAEERKSPAQGLTLPPFIVENKKKKGKKNKPETSSPQGKSQKELARRKAELAKTLKEIKITTDVTNLKRNAIEKLKQCSARLLEANCQLVEEIQDTDESTARQARRLLQQYEAFQRMKAMVQTFNKNQLDAAKAELQEMEKTMEKNLEQLQQQLEDVTSKVQALQEELRVVRPYIDGHYPEQAVKIILLQHSIRKLKRQQKEEIEKAEEMGKHILEQLEKKAQAEQEALLQKIVEEMMLNQDGLRHMMTSNNILRRDIARQREIIQDLEEEIDELKRSIQTLRQNARDPRELIFADVLLRRPKCTPDTEVVLSIPTEETPLLCCHQAPPAGP
ncbi:uncharacterized protein C20orf96 homolog isoform X2 [Strigops habroptila]|uniref:uncharacterized protein C20orf96 homolog isoform X2 n=1 Tax=Strigops habroptila TaxID=2489341 RepID=UPI0011CF0475|nr:uncharacterized protein C20orf96 homolog isoform X2 [Strigops habroptila]